MAIYRPSELRELLAKLGTHPTKRLSQNFLVDGNIIRNIVKAATPQRGTAVLEIGPGHGALPAAVLAEGAQVVAEPLCYGVVCVQSRKELLLPGAEGRLSDRPLHTACATRDLQ